jgi:FkbM family methyltransferase
MSEDLKLFETATGKWWLPNAPGDIVANAMKSGQIFDAPIVCEAQRYIRPGTVVLDLGANFGQMTVLFARLVGPQGHVHSFEGEPLVADILKKNVEANGVTEIVTIHRGAVWHTSGLDLIFPEPDLKKWPAFGSYGIVPSATEGRRVRSLTIDELNIQGPISFCKVDIQGADLFALQGARKTIERERMPILFEFERPPKCEDFGTSFSDYADFVRNVGYSFVRRIHLDADNFLICPRKGIRADWRDRTIRAEVRFRSTKSHLRAVLSKHPAMERWVNMLRRSLRR